MSGAHDGQAAAAATPRKAGASATPDPQYTATTAQSDATPMASRVRIPLSNSDLEIYQASYSGVPVIEMTCRGVSVMRRRSDGALNATQILKVAGIGKGQRTKILEREIHTGPHDKVQGGYGKYQGTWIPFSIGLDLCARHGCRDLLSPLIDLDMDDIQRLNETPTKEQHMALNKQTKQYNTKDKGSSSTKPTETAYRGPGSGAATYAALQAASAQKPRPTGLYNDDRVDDIHNVPYASAPQPLPNPFLSQSEAANAALPNHDGSTVNETNGDIRHIELLALDPALPPIEPVDVLDFERSREQLTNLFLKDDHDHVSDSSLPAAGSDQGNGLDVPIDELGHTALHWAASLARLPLVRALRSRGATTIRGNMSGETALIRAVLVTNNSDQNTFKDLLELLSDSLRCCDHQKRSVLHHIALTAGIPGRATASRYYLETLLEWIVVRGQNVGMDIDTFTQSLVDARDKNGDTALNIASRLGNKSLVQRLLEVRADPYIANRAGLRPVDSGVVDLDSLEDESERPLRVTHVHDKSQPGSSVGSHNEHARRAIADLVESLQMTFQREAEERNAEQAQVRARLREVAAELAELRQRAEKQDRGRQRLELVRQRIANTRRAIETEQQEFEDTAEDDDPHETDSIASDGSIDADKPFRVGQAARDQEPDIARLRARLAAYGRNADILESLARSLRLKSSELEQRCRRVVSLCTGAPADRVEALLPQLLQAVEADGPATSEETSRIAGFLKIVNANGLPSIGALDGTIVGGH